MSQAYFLTGFPTWLFYSAVSGLFILGVAAIAVRFTKQPLYRIGIIQWSFIACLLVPIFQQARLWTAITVPIAESAVPPVTLPRSMDAGHRPLRDVSNTSIDEPMQIASIQEKNGDKSKVPMVDLAQDSSAASQAVSSASTSTQLVTILQLAYLALVALIAGRFAWGWLIRHRLQRTCQTANSQAVEALRSISGDSGKRVRLLTSDRIVSPIMWGWFRPTIVVPAEIAESVNQAQLKWSLAHEWSHIHRHDFLTLQLANLTKFVCFFQPLYWWLKRELMLSQDFLADAFAAGHGQSEDYAEFLVKMARKQNTAFGAVGLGIADRQSNLFKRISALVQPSQPIARKVGRLGAMMLSATALALIALIGSVHVAGVRAIAEEPDEATAAKANAEKPLVTLPPAPGVAPITYNGRVVDAVSGEPLAGAIVQIRHILDRSPFTKGYQLIETTTHETDKTGQYQFTLPPEQVAQRSLYIEVKTQHSSHQSKGWEGYGHSMIRTNLEKGDPPFFETIKLNPGKEVTGVIVAPDGTPIPDLQVLNFSHPPVVEHVPGESWDFPGVFDHVTTDKDGRFRAVVATPGDGILWIYPKSFAAEAIRLHDRRGDLGIIKTQNGNRITGKLLDAEGAPIANVGVELRRDGDGSDADELLSKTNVANAIRAAATTQQDGTFEIAPLPAGKYTIEVAEAAQDPTEPEVIWFERNRAKLRDVFIHQRIEIVDGNPNGLVTVQALPHVTIRGKFVDSQGMPRTGHAPLVSGSLNDQTFFSETSRPGEDGLFEVRIPRGLTKAQIHLTTNEHCALRWKLPGMDQPKITRWIKFDKIDTDIDGLEVVRYDAPILLVSAVDEEGKPLDRVEVSARYAPTTSQTSGGAGESGESSFARQADGRYRSSQLQPKLNATVSAKREGFTSEPQIVNMNERETREITIVLKKANP